MDSRTPWRPERPGGKEGQEAGPNGHQYSRERFSWLHDARLRRGSLAMVRRAVLRGWLESAPMEVRAALVEKLMELLNSTKLGTRERVQVARILLAMMRSNVA